MLVLKDLPLIKLMEIILICLCKLYAYTPNVGLHSLIFLYNAIISTESILGFKFSYSLFCIFSWHLKLFSFIQLYFVSVAVSLASYSCENPNGMVIPSPVHKKHTFGVPMQCCSSIHWVGLFIL